MAWRDTHRHELMFIGRVRLYDGNVRDAHSSKAMNQLSELVGVGLKDDDVGTVREFAGAGFASGVSYLSCLESSGKICPSDEVVNKLTVKGEVSSWLCVLFSVGD